MPEEPFSLDNAIIERYIRPLQRPRTDRAGLEFELPIVNRSGAAVDYAVVHEMTDAFVTAFGFGAEHRDDDGYIHYAADPVSGDTLSFECSYNTLEFSFAPAEDLNAVYDRFRAYYSFVQDFLRPREHTLTGMGINPRWDKNRTEPVAIGRYRLLMRHLRSCAEHPGRMEFHEWPQYALFVCASQVQLDAQEDTVIGAINAFNRLEPWKALLFANSPWGEYLCGRAYLDRHGMFGFNPRNVGGYDEPLRDVEDLIRHIRATSLFCVERDGHDVRFTPAPLEEYFASPVVRGEYFDGSAWKKTEFTPRPGDMAFHRSYKCEDLTFRGTIEFRSACQQPVSEIMTPAAFHAGLMEELGALTELLDAEAPKLEGGKTPMQLRDLYIRRKLPEDLDAGAASAFLTEVLRLAERGLRRRGHGEEKFLSPLYERARTLMSPARRMMTGMENGKPLEYYIEEYSRLD